jgi:hypothetical protein
VQGACLTLAAALLAAGCGAAAGTDPAGGSGLALLDRLTAGKIPGATVVDLQRVRRDLGLGDLDPTKAAMRDPAQQHYRSVYGAALPLLEQPVDVPALAAIDLGRVTAAANNGPGAGADQVVVLATDQSFTDVSVELETIGYMRDGDVLRRQNPTRTAAASVVAGGPGVIALGQNRDEVQAAARGTAAGIHGAARDLLGALNAPAAVAVAPGSGCMTAVAIADDIDGGAARLAVATPRPRADRLAANKAGNGLFDEVTFGTVAITGDRLTVGMTYPQDGTSDPVLDMLSEASPNLLYDCAP